MKASRPTMEELKGDENRVQGRRRYYVWNTAFEVEDRYVLTRPIGRGAYGVVCAAKDLQTGETRAVKKISQVFQNLTDAKRTIREVKLLRHLKHKNVIRIHDIMTPADPGKLRDLYVVYELMDTDLFQVLKSKQELTDEHTQYFIYQVVSALYFIHSANVIHRDLKPSNLVLNTSCELKICDFGLARACTDAGEMTQYVVTRWYRAPELLIGCEEYTSAIDVWSTGCILAELLLGKPLFEGRDYMHQLRLIIGTLGTPSGEDLRFIKDPKILEYIRRLPPTKGIKFSSLLPQANPLAVEVLECMLVFHPSRRCTMADAMAHPYFAAYHKKENAVRADQPFDQDFSSERCDEKGLRELLMEEIQLYHPEPLHKKITLSQGGPGKWRKLDINKAG